MNVNLHVILVIINRLDLENVNVVCRYVMGVIIGLWKVGKLEIFRVI
jgi:hypothetical protein